MADRFLRQLLFRCVSKDPFKPSQGLAKIAAKTGRKREVMGYQANIFLIGLSLGGIKSDTKLFLRFDPLPFDDLAKAARIRAFDICFRIRGSKLRHLIKQVVRLFEVTSPAFDRRSGMGTLTAGNSTPLTDGASAVLLASEEWARQRNLPILAWFSYSKQWAVDYVGGKEGLLMAPAYAVPSMLKDANLTLQDFDFYEIHEAFAAQVLCTLKAWESPEYCKERLGLDRPLGSIDRARLNVNGSSVAIGHPFAATGTRIVAQLAKQLSESATAKRGLISVCTAGGMGVVAILEKA